MQVRLGEEGDVIAMIDDGGVQVAMLAVGIAYVDGRQDHLVFPGAGGFDQQHRGWAMA
ncbi:hypothetical protein D3C75_1361070 [compost metagenome]